MNEAPTRARILSESAWFTGGVALLSASFWVLDFVTDKPSWLPKQLPLGAFMACVPAVVAVLMARRSRFDVARPRVLRAPEPAPRALILQAIALIGTAALVAAATVTDRKDYPADVGILPAVALAAALVAAAWLEEVGWQGFLFPRLARLWGHYASAFGVGTIWAAWHVPLFLQAGRPAAWVLWWSLATSRCGL